VPKPRQKDPVEQPILCAFCGSEARYVGELYIGERKYPDGSLVRDDPEIKKDPVLWVCDNCKKRGREGKLSYAPYKHAKILHQLNSIRKKTRTAGAKKEALLLLKELATYFEVLEEVAERRRDAELLQMLSSSDQSDLWDAKLTEREKDLVLLYRENPLLSEKELADRMGIGVGTVKSTLSHAREKLLVGCTKDLVLKRRALSEEELQKDLAEFKKNLS
jgi:DNA-directed RNA polymerase specialized sigma24 family protein